MLNVLWLGLLVAAVLLGGFAGRMDGVAAGAVDGAKAAVTLSIGLMGIMALWLGLMRLAEKSGLVERVAHALQPGLKRLFPEVPAGHPAMASMVIGPPRRSLRPIPRLSSAMSVKRSARLRICGRQPSPTTPAPCSRSTAGPRPSFV